MVGVRERMLHIVTVATQRNHFLEDWERSVYLWGYRNVHVLAEGETWRGFGTWTNAVIRFLTECDAEDLVVIVDCYDLLVCGPEKECYVHFVSEHPHSCELSDGKNDLFCSP